MDLSALAARFAVYRSRNTARRASGIMGAINQLRRCGLPAAYVDGLQDELLSTFCAEVPPEVMDNVYLAFHGAEVRATHMKIGVAKHVGRRMSELSTGNPLPRLWVFAATLPGRHIALKVEAALLRHMQASRTSGEWSSVGEVSESAAEAIVLSLAEVAAEHTTHPVLFERVEV